MPYQNDLATLAQVVGPAYAAQQAGIQNDAAAQEQQMKNQVYQNQMPALSEQPGLENLFNQARTAGQEALNQGETLKNIGTAGTLGSSINATNAGNQLKITQDQMSKIQTLTNYAGAIADSMDNTPPLERPFKMQQIMQQQGIDPQQLGPMASGDPDMIRKFRDNLVQKSAGYQQAMGEQNLRNEGSANVATINQSGAVEKAQIMAQAQLEKQQLVNQMRQQQQTFEQAAVRLQSTNPELAQQYAQAALQLRQAQAGITGAMVGQPLTMPNLNVGTPQQSQPGGTTAPGGGDIEAEMKRRGLIK